MTMPERIQLKRTKGWRIPPNTVKVCRPGRYGNPYKVAEHTTQAEAVVLYRRYLETLTDLDLCILREDLKGKNLACWCKQGTPCHADALLELANT
jgi:hypothetical protein